LTTVVGGLIVSSMADAVLLLDERHLLTPTRFVAIRVWRVERPVRASTHRYKYSLALIDDGVCVLRFDNEAGKGDHRHDGDRETPYAFESFETLIADFWSAIDGWRSE